MDRIETEHGIFTANHITGETAEEVYQEWLKNKDETNKIDICHENRVKTNEELTEEQIKMQKIIADLEIESIINN